jgi:hypothetical protein
MRRDVTEEYLSDKWKYSMAAFDGVMELHIQGSRVHLDSIAFWHGVR